MKKLFVFILAVAVSATCLAQTKIQLRSSNKAECVKSDMTSLRASFSFSTIEAENLNTKGGEFSWLSMPNTVIGGNEGDPQIPVINELIAVPVGAQPTITVTSFSTTDYNLSDLGIEKLIPRQPSLRKDQKPEEVPFVYNKAAYQSTRGLRSAPNAAVSVEGTMRGVQLGKMTIEPMSYDPVNNTIRVFNDIEVTVSFDDADAKATEDMLVKTYTPYFDIVYAQLFNGRMVRDAYSEHPDLYTTPVKMIVITTSTYANNQTFQNWVNWKKQKGIYTTVYTTATTGTTASSIKSFIRNKYNEETPTFVVIVGDTDDVTYSLSSSITTKVTDLYYSTTSDSDIYPDLFLSRMPISSTTELENLLNKIMTYEQYTMSDPSYLNKVLLIAGSDGTWNPRVGQPTINYAADNYFNAAHGFTNVYKYLTDYTNCYNNMNTGIGFANYTAHGGETGWSGPSFSVSDANNLTNNDKYFWAMGNCCLAANWGYSSTCLAEALLRAANKGAFGYIGSCPETYWWEDYYFGVGATTVTDATPSMSQTQTGCYDAVFMDDMYNTLNSVPYLGNVAVTYAHANSYQSSITDTYYWEAYHCLGDGSVMPYHVNPSANNVSHASTIGIGFNTFTVNADAGSYVAITKDNEILGVAQVDATGIVNVPITPVATAGDVLVVVTRQQRQPYMQTIQAVSLEGPYISLDSYTPTSTHVGDNTNLSITFKNVGAYSTTGNTNITLSSNDVEIIQGTGSFGALAPEATTTVNGFSFKIAEGVADGTVVTIHYIAENGSDTYEGNIAITANEAVLKYQNMAWNGGFTPGETLTLSAKFKNTGHYQATNAVVRMTTTASNYVTINTQPISAGTIEAGQEVTYDFSVTIASNCPETAVLPVTFMMTADGGLSVTGTENLKNACNVIFNLSDSYGDGWNGAALVVSFDDGTESQSLTVSSGNSAEYVLEIGNGTHVTLTWSSGSYDSECSFTVSYEGDLIIYQSSTLSAGVLYEFDCNCAAASQTYMVTVSSQNTAYGTVSGGGEYSFGESCTVTATPAEGYYFAGWLQDGELVEGAGASYTFIVNNDVSLVATFAEGLMIGDGGSTTDQYLPSYSYYNYTLSQQIYTTEELGSAGYINSIAFFNEGSTKTRSYDVYMVSTTKSTFSGATDWVTVTSDNLMFSGSVEMIANDWTTIDFSTPFVYDGVSNVVLVVDDNTGSYSQGLLCRVFDAPNQALRIYSDGTNYNPLAPSGYTGTVMDVKNQLMVTKNALNGCVNTAPSSVVVNDIIGSTANVTWTGFSESYNVCSGVCEISTLVDEDFSESIPTDWTNNSAYPWTIVDGHIQSGNAGVASSISSISITLNFSAGGTIEFDAECMGEGSKGVKTVWDKCIFSIDGTEQFTNGANISGWKHYSFEVAAGEHTFSWSYSKDTSVNPTGDYFAIDNVVIKTVETNWNEPVTVTDTEYTLTGLAPQTNYCVKVQGVCNGVESAWSETVTFMTNLFKHIVGYGDNEGGYYFIASPVDNVNPTTVVGMTVGDYDLYSFDQSQEGQEWQNYKTSNFNLEAGQGYLYAHKTGVDLTISGTPAAGPTFDVTLNKTNGTVMSGWNLVGNPFGVPAYITRACYTMNGDGYVTIGANQPIEVMQGVLVMAGEDGESLTFSTTKPATKSATLSLNVTSESNLIDRAIVSFGNGRNLDKITFRENNSKLYMPVNGKEYAVVYTENEGEMPVNFKAEKNGTYTLSFNIENIELGYLHLIDNKTGNDIDLLATPSYTFDANMTDYASRFKLVFAAGNNSNEQFAFIGNGEIILNGIDGNTTVQLFDVTGRMLSSTNGANRISIENMAAGVYMLRLVNGNDVKIQKIVVK